MGKNKNKCKTKDCENKTEKRKHYCSECSVAKKTKTTLVKCWSCKEVHPGIGQFCPHCCAPASGPANEDATPTTESDVMSKVKRFPKEDVAALTQQFERVKLDMTASGDASSSEDSNRPAQEQPGTLSETSTDGGHKALSQQSTNNISAQCSPEGHESAATSGKSNNPSEEDHTKSDASSNSVEANSAEMPEQSHQPSEDNSGKTSNPVSVDGEPKPDKDGMHSAPVVVRSTTIAVPSEGCDMQNQSKEKVGMVNSAPPDGNTTNSDAIKPDAGRSKSGGNFDVTFVDDNYVENYAAGFAPQGVQESTNKGTGAVANERQENQVFGSSVPDTKSVGPTFGTNQKSVDNTNKSASEDVMSPSVMNRSKEGDHGTPLETSTNGGHKNQQSTNKNAKSDQRSSGDNTSAAPAKGMQNENANLRQSDNNQTNTGTEGSSVDNDPMRNKSTYAQATELSGSQGFKPGESDNRRGEVKLFKKALKDIGDSNQNKSQRTGIPKVLTDGDAKEKMTVCFHVVVTPEFQFNPKTDKIVIRFGTHNFGNFGYDVVEMDYLWTEDGYAFVEGKLAIKPSYISYTNIQYKYCLKRTGDTGNLYFKYEWIHKGYSPGIINRLLKIPKEACIKQGTWSKFDGAMQIKETEMFRKPKTESKALPVRIWNSLKNMLKLGSDIESKLIQDHLFAMHSYLPQWEGFVCNQKGQKIVRETAPEAINRLCDVTECMSGILVTPDWYTLNYNGERWKPGNFSVEKVLQNYFIEKLKEIGRDEKNLSLTMLSQRLVSGLAIAIVDKRCPFLEHETRQLLLKSLILPSDLEKAQYKKLIDDIEDTFSSQHMRSVAEALENLCNRAMNPIKSSEVDLTFILVLPLLHFVRGESKPMEWPEALSQYTFDDDRWWGHSNLNVKGCQGKRIHQMEDFSPMLVKIQPLLSVDLLLQRTFLATLRFEALDILKHMKFDFLVACAFVGFSLNQKRLLTSADIGDLKLILPDLVKHGKEENTTCGERCNVELHFRQRANVCDVVLQTVEVLMTNTMEWETLTQYLHLFSEALKQFEVHAGGDKESIQKAITQRTHHVLTLTLKYFRTFDIFLYLMVVNGFFNITFTNEKANYVWISGLLNFLVRQIDIKNVEYLIRYYCNNDLSAFHMDIQKAFSDKAFGAINQVMKNPEQFFNTQWYSGNNSKARIRALLSHFVNQSWDGKTVTLKMCLTWRALSGFFRQSDSITILDEKAQTQVLTVKSKIEDATARLINGDVMVEELQVLREHKEHFLALCEVIDVLQITRLCSQKENVIGPRDIVSKILECRERELTSFEDERYRVGILLGVCSSLHHGEFFNYFK